MKQLTFPSIKHQILVSFLTPFFKKYFTQLAIRTKERFDNQGPRSEGKAGIGCSKPVKLTELYYMKQLSAWLNLTVIIICWS